MTTDADARRVRRASMRVGIWVGVASVLVIAAGVGVLISVILLAGRPERGPEDDSGFGGRDADHIVVDVDRIVPLVIALGILGVCLLALVAWFAARRSVRPLAAALTAQRNFVSDASHELRTPLTALTSRIQILQRRQERGEPIAETVGDLRRNAATMDDVLTDLLLSAEGEAAPAGSPTDAASSVAAAADSLRPLADERGVTLRVDASGAPVAAIPAVTLTRLCVALIDNAIQHTRENSTIGVAATAADGFAEIRVSDQGLGIRLDDADRIFERFARGRETGHRRGFGLGLSLVRDVAARHGGSISVEKTSSDGTTFLLRLPSA